MNGKPTAEKIIEMMSLDIDCLVCGSARGVACVTPMHANMAPHALRTRESARRHVDAFDADCPKCGAFCRNPCMTSRGMETKTHEGRYRLAIKEHIENIIGNN